MEKLRVTRSRPGTATQPLTPGKVAPAFTDAGRLKRGLLAVIARGTRAAILRGFRLDSSRPPFRMVPDSPAKTCIAKHLGPGARGELTYVIVGSEGTRFP